MPQLKETHEKFLSHLKDNNRANATIIAYSKDIEQLIDFLAERSKFLPNEVLKEDLGGFLEKLEKENYTPKSISRKINAIRTFFKFLKSGDLIEDDPSVSLVHPKIEIKPPRILSAVEYRALRDACRNEPRTAAIVELLLQTGIRIGELRRLKMDDIEFGENGKPGKMRVGEWGKTAEREVPLNKPAQEALRKYLETRAETKEETVFVTRTGRPLLIRNIRTTINRYFKLAGVENVKVNDLRHTFVATHLSRGVSLTTISKLAGHRRLTTTEKYLEHIEQPSEEKVELGEL
jgi:site-specific recombinase XerD